MSRQPELGDPRIVARRFVCDACGRVVMLRDWSSRPPGWWIVFPPADGSLCPPLELHACSLTHACNLLANLARKRALADDYPKER